MRRGPSVLFAVLHGFLLFLLPAAPAAAQARWDGERDFRWNEPANWSGDQLPRGDSSVLFDSSASLAGAEPQVVFVSNSVAGDLIIDLTAWAVRPQQRMDALEIFGEGIVFTDRFTGEGAFTTFAGASNDRALRLRFSRDAVIINHGGGAVQFGTRGKLSGFGIANIGSRPVDLRLDGSGSGGFIWEGGSVFKGIGRFGTAEDFTAVFEIRGGRFNMSLDLRAEGGTIRIAADDVIGDHVNLTLNSRRGAGAAVIDISGARDVVGGLNAFNSGGTLRVDADTHYTFKSYNGGPINVEGFVEGKTVLRFSTIDDQKRLEKLLINGQPVAGWGGSPTGPPPDALRP